jgi:hypothetical protein
LEASAKRAAQARAGLALRLEAAERRLDVAEAAAEAAAATAAEERQAAAEEEEARARSAAERDERARAREARAERERRGQKNEAEALAARIAPLERAARGASDAERRRAAQVEALERSVRQLAERTSRLETVAASSLEAAVRAAQQADEAAEAARAPMHAEAASLLLRRFGAETLEPLEARIVGLEDAMGEAQVRLVAGAAAAARATRAAGDATRRAQLIADRLADADQNAPEEASTAARTAQAGVLQCKMAAETLATRLSECEAMVGAVRQTAEANARGRVDLGRRVADCEGRAAEAEAAAAQGADEAAASLSAMRERLADGLARAEERADAARERWASERCDAPIALLASSTESLAARVEASETLLVRAERERRRLAAALAAAAAAAEATDAAEAQGPGRLSKPGVGGAWRKEQEAMVRQLGEEMDALRRGLAEGASEAFSEVDAKLEEIERANLNAESK